MGFFIVSLILIIIGIFIFFNSKFKDFGYGIICIGISIFFGVALLAIVQNNTDRFMDRYDTMKYELNIYHNSVIKANYHYLSYLDEQMTSLNNEIERTRKYTGTFWLGWFNSSDIAKLKTFNIKKELDKQ